VEDLAALGQQGVGLGLDAVSDLVIEEAGGHTLVRIGRVVDKIHLLQSQ